MQMSASEYKRIEDEIAAEREEWIASLNPKDWLFDGTPIRNEEMLNTWRKLDWSRAYIDMGPSPMGNRGPYWKVPLVDDCDETVHRLYPKIRNRLLLTIRQAVVETHRKSISSENH